MKYFSNSTFVGVVLAGILSLELNRARADLEVSTGIQIHSPDDFYQPLTADGEWINIDSYGRCWRPEHVDADWRPYCDGEWVWTDCGWYWQSDEPWAWACYHYGAWSYEPAYGWLWVPGVIWAPAWVDWRMGDGHIGWAPCAPGGGAAVSTAFVFVDEDHFQKRHRRSDVIVNNPALFEHTRVVAGAQRESRDLDGRRQTVVVNSGPDAAAVETATGRRLTPVSISDANRRTAIPQQMKRRPEESPGQPAPEPERIKSEPGRQILPEPAPGQPLPGRFPPRQPAPEQPVPEQTQPERKLPPATPEIPNPNRPGSSERNIPPASKDGIKTPHQPAPAQPPAPPQNDNPGHDHDTDRNPDHGQNNP